MYAAPGGDDDEDGLIRSEGGRKEMK